MTPWRDAWHDALYGPEGFYRREPGPGGHFTTATHGALGAVLAGAVARLADAEGATHIVDVGCGRGELLRHLHQNRPDLRLTGVDVVERPTGLPESVGWVRSPGGGRLPDDLGDPGAAGRLDGVLVLANEWLDVVPCTIAELIAPGTLAVVHVDPTTGAESPSAGAPGADGRAGPTLEPTPEELAWCAAHWPVDDLPVGARVEIGLARDQAWQRVLQCIRRGTAVAVDYGHVAAARPGAGTLTGYRAGSTVRPVPDGGCDLTAHVAVDSLRHDELLPQHEALRGLGVSTLLPPREAAATDPGGYLAAVAGASTSAALTDPAGLGGFWWVVARVPG